MDLLLFLFLAVKQPEVRTSASWYGPGLYGNKMANGEVLKKSTVAVAHREFPFGTKLLVTNLNNNKSIEVIVKDRGPFVEKHKRTLDLTYAAAVQLDMIDSGVVKVKYEKILD